MKKGAVNTRNARKGEYRDVINKIDTVGKCPFCKENFKYHKKPILKREKGWFVTENSWPYKNTQHHFIIIGEKHKEEFSELNQNDFAVVAQLTKWVIRRYKIKGGAFTMRFGNTDATGASVTHLHFHILVPEKDKRTKRTKRVSFPVG